MSISWVSNLVKKVKKNQKILQELAASEEQRLLLADEVSEAISKMYQENEYLSSVKYV